MMEKLLPRLQLVFVVLFAAISLCGPIFFGELGVLILAAALFGILLGIITFIIGWRLAVARGTVSYPFPELSMRIIKLFLSTDTPEPELFKRSLSPLARQALGIASMAVGTLLVIGLVVISIIVISS